jgi:chromosome segregation ATPase
VDQSAGENATADPGGSQAREGHNDDSTKLELTIPTKQLIDMINQEQNPMIKKLEQVAKDQQMRIDQLLGVIDQLQNGTIKELQQVVAEQKVKIDQLAVTTHQQASTIKELQQADTVRKVRIEWLEHVLAQQVNPSIQTLEQGATEQKAMIEGLREADARRKRLHLQQNQKVTKSEQEVRKQQTKINQLNAKVEGLGQLTRDHQASIEQQDSVTHGLQNAVAQGQYPINEFDIKLSSLWTSVSRIEAGVGGMLLNRYRNARAQGELRLTLTVAQFPDQAQVMNNPGHRQSSQRRIRDVTVEEEMMELMDHDIAIDVEVLEDSARVRHRKRRRRGE